MRVLALDATTRLVSVAIVDDDRVLAERSCDPGRPAAEQLPGALVDVMNDCALTPALIDVFAVATGPGSFTGLRIGIATMQGFAIVQGRPIIPVSALDALGHVVAAEAAPGTVVAAWADAFRREVFSALYRVGDGPPFTDARLVPLAAPIVADPAFARSTWGEETPTIAIGNGAVLYRSLLEPTTRVVAPGLLAASVGRIGPARAKSGGALDPSAVQPLYLRRPDVEIERERRSPPPPATIRISPSGPWIIDAVQSPTAVDDVLSIETASFTNPWTREMYMRELGLVGMSLLFLAHDSAGRPVGFCSAWRVLDELQVNNLAVMPDVRRRGVARALLRRTFDEGLALGVRRATLEVRRSNTAARQLYESLGFVVAGVRADYYTTPVEDALVLWCENLASTGA